MDSNLVDQMMAKKHLLIEAADGKEYSIDSFLPLAAYFVYTANYNLILKLTGYTDGESVSAENVEEALKAICEVVKAANKKKYPELTTEYMLENFDADDLFGIITMYSGEVTRQAKKKTSKVKPPKKQSPKKEATQQ